MKNNDNTSSQVVKLSLSLSLPFMLQRPCKYQTMAANLSFDTLLGLNYEILWIKLFNFFLINFKNENHSKFSTIAFVVLV